MPKVEVRFQVEARLNLNLQLVFSFNTFQSFFFPIYKGRVTGLKSSLVLFKKEAKNFLEKVHIYSFEASILKKVPLSILIDLQSMIFWPIFDPSALDSK